MVKNTGLIILTGLIGILVGIVLSRTDSTLNAQTVDNKNSRWLAGTINTGGGTDAFVLFDSQTNRLLMYTLVGKTLELVQVRDIGYDLKPRARGIQRPTIDEVYGEWQKWEEEQKKKKQPDTTEKDEKQ